MRSIEIHGECLDIQPSKVPWPAEKDKLTIETRKMKHLTASKVQTRKLDPFPGSATWSNYTKAREMMTCSCIFRPASQIASSILKESRVFALEVIQIWIPLQLFEALKFTPVVSKTQIPSNTHTLLSIQIGILVIDSWMVSKKDGYQTITALFITPILV